MEYENTFMGKRLNTGTFALQQMDYNGIIGVEAAAGYWGLCTFNHIANTILLFNDNTLTNEGICEGEGFSILFVPNVNYNNTINLSKHLRVTDPEQTVCDMIRYNRHEFHLYETVYEAIEGSVNINRLEQLAKEYNILDRLYSIYKEAEQVIDEG